MENIGKYLTHFFSAIIFLIAATLNYSNFSELLPLFEGIFKPALVNAACFIMAIVHIVNFIHLVVEDENVTWIGK